MKYNIELVTDWGEVIPSVGNALKELSESVTSFMSVGDVVLTATGAVSFGTITVDHPLTEIERIKIARIVEDAIEKTEMLNGSTFRVTLVKQSVLQSEGQ